MDSSLVYGEHEEGIVDPTYEMVSIDACSNLNLDLDHVLHVARSDNLSSGNLCKAISHAVGCGI